MIPPLILDISCQNNNLNQLYLSERYVFRPYLDENFLKQKEQETEIKYPVLLPVPGEANNFYIYLVGNDPNKYKPGILPMGAGDPDACLNQMVIEALENKKNSNRLIEKHPKLLLKPYFFYAF
jgi:hypothetical protein